ncbi:hypothetical protein ACLB2K_031841 [Fragaria x ananassa]
MPPRHRPRVDSSTNASEGVEVRGLVDLIGSMLRGVLDRVQQPRSVKKKDVFDAGAIEFKGAKGPLDAHTWVDKMEMAFERTDLPEEKKVKMAVTFLDDSTHHWWTLASRNSGGTQDMTWEEFKTLFLGQYFGHAQRIRIQSDFLNMKKIKQSKSSQRTQSWVADLQMDVGSGKRKRNPLIESVMDSASDRGSGVDRETENF